MKEVGRGGGRSCVGRRMSRWGRRKTGRARFLDFFRFAFNPSQAKLRLICYSPSPPVKLILLWQWIVMCFPHVLVKSRQKSLSNCSCETPTQLKFNYGTDRPPISQQYSATCSSTGTEIFTQQANFDEPGFPSIRAGVVLVPCSYGTNAVAHHPLHHNYGILYRCSSQKAKAKGGWAKMAFPASYLSCSLYPSRSV